MDLDSTVDILVFITNVYCYYQREVAKFGSSDQYKSNKTKEPVRKHQLKPFNLESENYKDVKMDFVIHLSQIQNKKKIPLYYTICDPKKFFIE